MMNFQRLLASLFLGNAEAPKQTSYTGTPRTLQESQACYSRQRAALIEWRRETSADARPSYSKTPSASSGSRDSSSDPDTFDDLMMTLGNEA